MQTTAISLAALLGLSFTAAAQAPKVNFTDNILPIFKNACTNCHNPDKKKAGLDVTTYAATMAGGDSGAAVKPGNADGSLLLQVTTHAKEPTMPPKGDKLSEGDLKLIKDWIAAFALENANSKPAVAQANKVESALVSLTRPEGPAPMPGELPLEPFVKARALGAVTSLAASPWAPLIAVGGQKQVFLYHVESLEPLGVLAFPEGFPNVLRFSKNAKLLLAGGGLGGKSGKVVLWDVASGERIGAVGNESDAVLAADLSADHQFVALGGSDKKVRIYSTKDNKQTGLIKKHTEWVTAIAYSPDGKYLGTGDRNGGVEIWESGPEPKPFNSLTGHKSGVTALAFMPGLLATGGEDGTIKLWNVKEGNETKSFTAHAGGVLWLEFTPDGRIISCGRDKVAKVWDATGKALVTTEAFPDLATRAVMQGERVIGADWSGSIRVFALAGDKANKVGELTANPPGIGEQLSAAEKALAETGAAIPALQKAVADAGDRVKADLAAAEARKVTAQQKLDAIKAAPAAAEQAVAALNAKLKAAQEALVKANAELDLKKKGVAATGAGAGDAKKKYDALTTEIARLREARAKLKEGTPEYLKADAAVQQIKPELTKAEAALGQPGAPVINKEEVQSATAFLDKQAKDVELVKADLEKARASLSKVKDDMPKQTAEAEKAIAAADLEIASFSSQTPSTSQAAPDGKQAKAERLSELQKKWNALNAPLSPLREARSKFEKGTPAYEKADAAVQAKKTEIKYDGDASDKLAAQIEELQKGGVAAAPASAAPAPQAGAESVQALAKAKAALDAANARIAAAKHGVERWKRAQLFQNVFNARQIVTEKQAKYDDLTATAKDAFRQVELTKQAIIAAQKTIADAPKVIAEKEAQHAAARKTADDAKATLAAAEKAVEAKKVEMPDVKKIEAEVAELSKQAAVLTDERAKLREERNKFAEGSADYTAIQAKRDALKAKLTPLEASIEAAKARLAAKPGEKGAVPPELVDAVKKAQLDFKLASDKVAPAEKAAADARQAVAEATKQIPEMQARIPQLEAEGRKTKAQAELAAAATAKELQAAKAQLEKLRAQYDAARPAAGKDTASVQAK
jgi:Planctomycete cytochrome C/WD domain, G-beta repeat